MIFGPLLALPLFLHIQFPDTFPLLREHVSVWVILVLFCFFACTDWLDGVIARRFSLVTRFGAFLDPLADKIFIWPILFVFWKGILWPLLLVLFAIDIISTIERIANYKKEHKEMSASRLGKWKTFLLYTATFFFLWALSIAWEIGRVSEDTVIQLIKVGNMLLFFAFLCSVISMASKLHKRQIKKEAL